MARPVQQWREVLGSIHAYNESCAAGTPDLNQLRECEQLLNRSMDATGSNWHKFVYSEKVPLRLCAACCNDPSTVTAMAPVLLESLNAFLICMADDFDGAAPSKKDSSLMRSIRVQLEQADFLSHLPAVTASVLADLAALPEPAAVAQQLQEPGWYLTDGSTFHAGVLGSSLQGTARRAFHLQHLIARVELWWHSEGSDTAAAAYKHAAAMQLSTAVLQWVSCCLEHLPPQQQATCPPMLFSTLLLGTRMSVKRAAGWWNAALRSGTTNRTELLPLVPQFLSAAVVMLLVTTYELLLTDEQQQLSRAEQEAKPGCAWRVASDYNDVLPASNDELLRLLGCSSKAVLYTAALRLQTAKVAANSMVSLVQVLKGAAQLLQPLSSQQRQLQGQVATADMFSPAQQHHMCALYFLLPSMLLHCAARYPSSREHYQAVLDAASTGSTMLLCWLGVAQDHWEEHMESASLTDEELGLLKDLMLLSAEEQREMLQDVPEHDQVFVQRLLNRDKQQQCPLWPAGGLFPAAEWLASLHPLTLTEPLACAVEALRGVLAQAAQGQQGHWASRAQPFIASFRYWITTLMTSFDQQDSSSSQVLALKQQLHAAVQQHAAELCLLLDHCCRLQAQLPSSGTPAAGSAHKVVEVCNPAFFVPGGGHAVLTYAAGAAGPGSAEQQQLWSVLCSMIKYCWYSGRASSEDAYNSRWAVRHAVTALLLGEGEHEWHAGTHNSNGSAASSCTSSAAEQKHTGQPAQAVAAWLALCGRCLLLLSAELTVDLAVGPELMQATINKEDHQQWVEAANASAAAAAEDDPDGKGCISRHEMFLVSAVLGVLQDDSMSAQLSAAGYDASSAVGHLQMVAAFGSMPELALPAQSQPRSSRHAIGLQHCQLIRHLQEAGACLNDMPFSWGCNNPACSNLTGPSELQLVKGRSRVCSRCRTARYCDKACQTTHWKLHKGACKSLEAVREKV